MQTDTRAGAEKSDVPGGNGPAERFSVPAPVSYIDLPGGTTTFVRIMSSAFVGGRTPRANE
jgi:hypothetical protein